MKRRINMTAEKFKKMSLQQKTEEMKEYFTKVFTICSRDEWGFDKIFKPQTERAYEVSVKTMVDLMKGFGGFLDGRRIAEFKFVEFESQIGVKINNHIILDRWKFPYSDRFLYLIFDIIKYVVENLMDVEAVMMLCYDAIGDSEWDELYYSEYEDRVKSIIPFWKEENE